MCPNSRLDDLQKRLFQMSGCQYFPKIEISAIVAIKVDSGWVSPMAGKPLGKTQIISTASTLQNNIGVAARVVSAAAADGSFRLLVW